MDQTRKLEIFREAAEFLDSHGHEAHVRDDYLGRGMMGNTCPAIVTDAPGTLIGYAIGLAIDESEDHVDPADVLPLHSDGMGLQTVYY